MNLHKLQIASAVQKDGGRSHPNLSHSLTASTKIGQIMPIFFQPCVPGDKFNVHISMFSRFLPLAVPSYVKLNYRTFSCFVPYHQVCDGIESYIANQKKFKGVNSGIPYLTESVLRNTFVSVSEDVQSPDSADLTFYNTTTVSYRRLNAVGYYWLKFMQSIGLRIPTSLNSVDTSNRISALPLLAVAHAYNSYLSYSPNYNTSSLSQVLETLKRTPNVAVTSTQLTTIMSSILLTYEESFASLCWKSPFYSQSGTQFETDFNQTTINPNANRGDGVIATDAITVDPNLGAYTEFDQEPPFVSASQIRLLMKFDDYFRRSNYAGSKDIEQIYSRMGVKIDDYRTRYPYFLNESSREVNVGDVTSTADTEGASIGSYAGKAIGSGDAGFNFDCKDYGILVTFAWFAPKPVYYQGMDKEYLRLDPFDFYTPELDQGYPSAIQKKQFMENTTTANLRNNFGYAPLYSEYLYPKDVIVGDFTRYADYVPWHFGRKLDVTTTAQTDTLVYIPQQGSDEFERIFNVSNVDNVDQDSIFMHCDINVDCSRPMKDYTGKTMLGDGNLDVPALGSQLN